MNKNVSNHAVGSSICLLIFNSLTITEMIGVISATRVHCREKASEALDVESVICNVSMSARASAGALYSWKVVLLGFLQDSNRVFGAWWWPA